MPSRGTAASSARVYGWCGAREQLAHGRLLDDLPGVHHDHPLRALGDDAEVVRDEEHRHRHRRLQRREPLEDLRLDR